MAKAETIAVEVVYARADVQRLLEVEVPVGASLREVIERSGLLQQCPEIDLDRDPVGIFGRVLALDTQVTAGDRIEIYRPLQADPKEARRRRAKGRTA